LPPTILFAEVERILRARSLLDPGPPPSIACRPKRQRGVPFIRRLLGEVARFGVDDMVLIARGEAGALEPFLAENLDRPYRIRGVVAPQEAGDGGCLRRAAGALDRRFFLFSGHSFFDINLLDLVLAANSFPVALALERVADTGRRASFTTDRPQSLRRPASLPSLAARAERLPGSA
jgi:NDP-sugar pyrophosphorylase family protein